MTARPDPRLPSYPVLIFAAKYRKVLPLWAASLTLLLGLWASYRTSADDYAVVGLVGALIIYFATRGALELVELVTELLIPQ